MRKSIRFLLFLTGWAILLSCSSDDPDISIGYIKAKVNGVNMLYRTDANQPVINFIASEEFHITFRDRTNPFLYWTIDVIGIDLSNIQFPYVISGPNENYPVFYCNILDTNPANSAYGKILAGTSTNNWETTLTLLSIEGDHVKGTFEGKGVGALAKDSTTFFHGKFEATLPRVNN